MNADAQAAMRAIHDAVELLEASIAETEPAPISVVLIRDRSNGRVHRRARVVGIEGLMSYEGCNLDQAGVFDVIPDPSSISDELDFCGRCFGGVDDLMAQDR